MTSIDPCLQMRLWAMHTVQFAELSAALYNIYIISTSIASDIGPTVAASAFAARSYPVMRDTTLDVYQQSTEDRAERIDTLTYRVPMYVGTNMLSH